MRRPLSGLLVAAAVFLFFWSAMPLLWAATASSILGTVEDPAGHVISGATVKILNPVSGYTRTKETDATGHFSFQNVPYDHYHLTVTSPGFGPLVHDVNLESSLPVTLTLALPVAASSTVVAVTPDKADLVNPNPIGQTSVNLSMLRALSVSAAANGLSSAVTLQTPGVVTDSNGMFHPLGEHADTTFVVDGQPISDQQSRNFSNQLTSHAVQSIKVLNGVIPPKYGDKASIVVETATKSGLGDLRPTGDISVNYGSFGSSSVDAQMGIGTQKWGNFIDLNGTNSGRFMDTPEFTVMHDRGNMENFFDRIDAAPDARNTFHLDLTAARTRYQVPNQFDQQFQKEFQPPNPFNPLGLPQDQRQKNLSYNVAGYWTHIFGPTALIKVTPFIRQDNIHYYPSRDIFADTPVTLVQSRRLQNVGLTADYTFVHGVHTVSAGGMFQHTILDEGFGFGITDTLYNAVCVGADGVPVAAPGVTDPADCAAAGYEPNPDFVQGDLPFDLTRGGNRFTFKGHTDIKQEMLYLQDSIAWKSWQFLLGVRGDNYNGLSSKYMLEPRVGASYNIAKTGTVFSGGYSRLMPTPYNENLILSSSTGVGGLANDLGAAGEHPLTPASRNQYNVAVQQAIGNHVLVSGFYFWKHTKGDYDFDVILNTPLTFPIQWKKSDISGSGLRISLTPIHGVSAYSVMGHAHSLFYPPEIGGIIFNDNSDATDLQPFLIDHDQAFQQHTHLRYQPKADGPWYGFTWSYASGLVADAPFGEAPGVPVSLTGLTADQQQQIELSCNGVRATLTAPLESCLPEQLKSPLVTIPRAGTETDDKNPPRTAPRNLFDMDAGWDNIFRRSHYRTSLSVTVTNITDKVALYNFMSTFSGTHFVPPREITAQAIFNF